MNAPADRAWSRQLGGASFAQGALWVAAALAVLTAHAGAAWLVTRHPPVPAVAEAAAPAIVVDLSLLGYAAADQVSAGNDISTVEPVSSEVAQAVEPEMSTPTSMNPVEAVRPSEATVASLPPVEPQQAVEPAEPVPAEVETIRPVEEPQGPAEQEVAALVHVPLPTPRPAYTPPAEPPRRKSEQPVEKPAAQQRQRAGSGGENQADTRKGTADGSVKGKADARREIGRDGRAGDAAIANYPGRIASQLRRALRYPRGAGRDRLRGEVHVRFTVDRSGGVSGVRIMQSSGSQVLDRAALDTVRRAAPFPPIPDGANRPSWPFTVPLAFSR